MPDDRKPQKTVEERLAQIEEAVTFIIRDLDDLRDSRVAVFSTFGGLFAVLARKGVIEDGDVDAVVMVAGEIAEKWQAAEAAGDDPAEWFKAHTPKRRRRKRPRARNDGGPR